MTARGVPGVAGKRALGVYTLGERVPEEYVWGERALGANFLQFPSND
ncbi:MAG: hypothetical protein LKK46_06020 [Ancrocorticia sp.]|jgi:hypothetical protein|nr:hypothetical protein [Ancrocorticia sp.]